MKSPRLLWLSSNGALLVGKQMFYVSAVLIAGLPGCKEKSSDPAHEPKQAFPAGPLVNEESLDAPAPVPAPAAAKPEPNDMPAEPAAPYSTVAVPSKRDSETDKSGISLPVESAKSASSGLPRKRTTQEALAAAKKSRLSATEYARQGKLEPAYKAAVEGWQMVRTHQTDPNCKALTANLLDDIKKYSDRLVKAAGGEAGMPNASRPIRFE
ncbi:hypothetical protein [Lacipirellula sp.]|uniref:hypothetical protein n=1 Tax=Lacipirellula sp. TaxID=2691419 RepID=UPI003D0B0C1C